jgi:hypothetical protein
MQLPILRTMPDRLGRYTFSLLSPSHQFELLRQAVGEPRVGKSCLFLSESAPTWNDAQNWRRRLYDGPAASASSVALLSAWLGDESY